jgi:hypothetical protein
LGINKILFKVSLFFFCNKSFFMGDNKNFYKI